MARTINSLTETQIKNLPPVQKEQLLSDGNNLFLRLSPTGSKIWHFIYTHPTTKKRKKKNLGPHPQLSLSQARKMIFEYHSILNKGLDPFEYAQEQAKAEQLKAITLREVAEKWRVRHSQEVLEKTIKNEYRRLELHLFPLFGDMPISKLKINEVIEAFTPMYQVKADTTRKVIIYLNQIMEYAVRRQFISFNQLSGLKDEFSRHKVKNQPTIVPSELPDFLRTLRNSTRLITTKHLVKWQLLTMVRPNEAVSVEWSEIDFEAKIWHIPAHKMKGRKEKKRAHDVPLSDPAIAILAEMKKHNAHKKYVFAHRLKPDSPCHSETANNTIKSIGYKGKLTAHGMRSIACTYLNETGENPFIVEACLAHIMGNEVHKAYNKSDYLKLRKSVMQKWGGYVEQCDKM